MKVYKCFRCDKNFEREEPYEEGVWLYECPSCKQASINAFEFMIHASNGLVELPAKNRLDLS